MFESRGRDVTLAALGLAVVAVLAGCGGNGALTSARASLSAAQLSVTQLQGSVDIVQAQTVTMTPTVTVTTTYTPVPATAFSGDGEYLIGSDVQPGTYRSEGNDGTCYADTEDSSGNVDAQEIGSGQIILVVSARDYRVDVRDCSPFSRVS